MRKFVYGCAIVFMIISLTVLGTVFGWFDTWFTNSVEYVDRKIDDATNYDTRKKVEDTCRSMISSYESDKLVYEQYKDSVFLQTKVQVCLQAVQDKSGYYCFYRCQISFLSSQLPFYHCHQEEL